MGTTRSSFPSPFRSPTATSLMASASCAVSPAGGFGSAIRGVHGVQHHQGAVEAGDPGGEGVGQEDERGDGDEQKDFIKGLGIRFDVPMRQQTHNRHVRFAGESGMFRSSHFCVLQSKTVSSGPSGLMVLPNVYA